MRRDALLVAFLWTALTLVGEVLAAVFDFFPLAAAEEAKVVDDAFRILVILGIPVFTFVVAALVYSALRFRRRREQLDDGAPIRSNRTVVATWLLATTVLTMVVIIFPGVTGLRQLRERAHAQDQMVVQVEGAQWFWKMTYPERGAVSYGELVLPLGRPVRFEVSSMDVIHAFWVPAFRMKVDALPGRTTTVHATPDKTGTFQDNSGFRLQCAELCGVGHGIMGVPVRVVAPEEFLAWAAQHTPAPPLIR